MDILISAVGGQGALLASRIIGHVATQQGQEVKLSEVHGMSQRGGSVVTYVRFGKQVFSPVIEKGAADFILAFELLEAARYIEYLKPTGIVICNRQTILPMGVITGAQTYPETIVEDMKKQSIPCYDIDGLDLARKAGNIKAVNAVIIGAFARLSGIPYEEWTGALKATVAQRFLDVNLLALEAGYNAVSEPHEQKMK